MKILIVSLLRSGDLIMHLKAIENHLPDANIQFVILTHRQNRNLEFLLPKGTRFFYFDRELVQKSMKEDFLPHDAGFRHYEALIKDLNSFQFDFVYNFTNTKFSALLLSQVKAKKSVGLLYQDGTFRISDPQGHIKRLNAQPRSRRHLIEVFNNSLLNLAETPNSVSKQNKPPAKNLCFQVLTSDSKKNWPHDNWLQLVKLIATELPEYKIHLLGSPQEESILFKYYNDYREHIKILSFEEVYNLLQESTLLITGDTSIKHLASFTHIKILELVLGSSDPIETGVYSKNGYFLYSPETCQPCSHSKNCDYHYQCHNRISPQTALGAIKYILDQTTRRPEHLFNSIINAKETNWNKPCNNNSLQL